MIASLWLKNFRRYTDETFQFKSGINFITGTNNVGKSTIFYAIEYVLFGKVGHFKSPIALMQPGSRTVGVEIIFSARDGNFYRLQRIHALPPKARTKAMGHYTLKQLSGDPNQESDISESYVLSSDFQDHEEALALKLNELLGLTHKLFDVAINLRQGEITSVLEGAPKLDIVLGVTAAVLAAEQMRSMALAFEKDSATYELHLEQVKRLEAEKQTQTTQQQQLTAEGLQLEARAAELKALSTLSQQIEAVRLPLLSQHEALQEQLQTLKQLVDQQTHIEARYTQMIQQEGSIEQMQSELDKTELELNAQHLTKQEWLDKNEALSLQKSQLDQLLGDLSGRIKRRESLPSGEGAQCETCGQAIDSESHQKEIAQWHKESLEITQKTADIEQRKNTIQSTINTLDEASQGLSIQSNLHKRAIADLQKLQEEQQSQSQKIIHQESLLLTNSENILQAVEQYSKTVNTLKVDKEISQLLTLSLKSSDLKKYIKKQLWQDLFNTITPVLNTLEEGLKVRIIQADTELSGIKDNQQRVTQSLDQLIQREGKIEHELTGAHQQVEQLLEKQKAAETLRQLLAGFKELQTLLRDKVSKKLAQDTFSLYQSLSHPDKEFKSLSIDPNRYLINVTPYDLGKEVPAYLYQGGGHKLLLGVAFKLAIAKTVGPCSFMLLDEPTYGLDGIHRKSLLQRISELNITEQVFLITHHADEVDGHHVQIQSKGKTSAQEAL